MPTYEYVCSGCDHRLEIFQPMNSPPHRKCPNCGRLRLKRQIGAGAGILFRGSGFYETDYRSREYQKRAQEEKSAGSSKTHDQTEAGSTKEDKKKPASVDPPTKKEKPRGPSSMNTKAS